MYEVYFVLILCLYVGGLVKFCQRSRRLKRSRVMIQDQTYTCFNRRTRNNTSACVHCLPRWTKVFMKTPEHYFKTETQNKTTFDSWLLCYYIPVFASCSPTACKLNCCSFSSQSFPLRTFSQPNSITPSVHLQYVYWTSTSAQTLHVWFGQRSLQNLTQGKNHTQHKVQYLPSEQHVHYFNVSCARHPKSREDINTPAF